MRRQLANYLGSAAIGLAAFLATSALVHSLLPPMIPKGIAAKLRYFTEHKDEFDTVIIGTSRLYYAASPKIFDETSRANGLPTHTFNFGIDAMHPPENFFVLDEILKMKPRNLKWVLLEMGDIQTKWDSILGTERAVYWHDWPRTSLTLKKAINPRGDAGWFRRCTQRLWVARRSLASNLTLFGQRFANVGRVADLFPAAQQERFSDAALELGPNRDGYKLAWGGMSPERVAPYERLLAQEISQAHPFPLDPATDRAYRQAAADIRAAGAKPIFVVAPVIFQTPVQFRRSPAPAPVIAFNNAGKFPEYYEVKARVDESHLTREAAEKFTVALAREFVRVAAQP